MQLHTLCAIGMLLLLIGPAGACEPGLPPPGALIKQKELVETLQRYIKGVRDEDKVGQRGVDDILAALERYHREAETQQAMEACAKSDSARKVAEARIAALTAYIGALKAEHDDIQGRFNVGEVTQTAVLSVRAAMLQSEVRLTALKKAASQRGTQNARPPRSRAAAPAASTAD